MNSIAIIGGGPAGAMAAESLRRRAPKAFDVTIFEERKSWEKPCGGGLPAKALRRYPFLADASETFATVKEAELVAPNGEVVRFMLRAPIAVYSRAVLNRFLLGRAECAGARVVADHIREFCRNGAGWAIKGSREVYRADFIILAAGARTPLRLPLTSRFRPQDLMLTYGYYTPGSDSLLRVQFFEDFEGYAWAFPRTDHLSVGICGKADEIRMVDLRLHLHAFMQAFGYVAEHAPVFSHLLPALNASSWEHIELAGNGWAVAGDAGGLVDPLTGEGIYFAMRSGELLAETLVEGEPQAYAQKVRREFGRRLAVGARLAPRFYRGKFLGQPSTTRLVQFCRRSPAFMSILQDLFEGSQSYASLPGRLYRTLAKGVFQMAATKCRIKDSKM
ncbi:MAG: FAD/NAD(P)-binding protein [Terriglobia bacterium]